MNAVELQDAVVRASIVSNESASWRIVSGTSGSNSLLIFQHETCDSFYAKAVIEIRRLNSSVMGIVEMRQALSLL